MEVRVFKDYEELSKNTADFILKCISNKPDALLCLAAGDTPRGTYEQLVRMKNQTAINNCRFVGLDEWAGMDEKDEGSCKNFIYNELFYPLSIKKENYSFFDARAEDLQAECRKADDYILKNRAIDFSLVGLGLNGHIGFNEPGTPFDSYSHVVELDEVTKTVGQKYFKGEKVLDKGITLGLGHMMESKCLMLIASGLKKAQIIKRVVEGDISEEVPGTLMRIHKNSFIFLDRDAASALQEYNR